MNIPILPDKTYKLAIYIGIGLILYSWIIGQNKSEEYEKQKVAFSVEIKRLENERKYLDTDLKTLSKDADLLSRKFSIKNPLTVSDSGYIFIRTLVGGRKEVLISDSIASLLKQFDHKQKEILIKDDQLAIKRYELESLGNYLLEIKETFLFLLGFGGSLTFIGLIAWSNSDDFDAQLLKRQNIDKPYISSSCQSCGKKFNSMIRYGTENNNTKNYHFCNQCYSNGEFTIPDLTKEEMKVIIRKELVAKKAKWMTIKLKLLQLNNAERWQ